MEGGGLTRYWKRRGYGRLYGSRRWRMINRAKLGKEGGGSGRRKRSWGIKIARKLRLILSPKKLLIRLRDAYVNLMLRLDNSNMMMMNGGGFGGANSSFDGGFGKGRLKEYDEKTILQMYKSLVMAQGLLAPWDPTTSVVTYPRC
ncbi:hypothetical protein RHSIM_Rhsim01G0288700 [Rhododendron simsii]|uniref:Uncharacterized protein n=1 Tax=Rhododendron simsii TaxID=118357 RepID=A0A834HGT3_RHOSS|nr:hypothetical protein RHSIM_Rhsim01G0288700 [Rhododendron simsii]